MYTYMCVYIYIYIYTYICIYTSGQMGSTLMGLLQEEFIATDNGKRYALALLGGYK